MIAVEKFGTNFMGALAYNLKKLDYPDKKLRAEVLATSFSSLSVDVVKKETDLIRALRPALNKYVWHTSLNFSEKEDSRNLTNDKLLEIGLDYMTSMGYDDNQYLIVRHHDAEHPHIHLLVNRIRYDGSVVSDSNNYRKSQAVLRRLEQQYNLIPIEPYNYVTVEQGNHVTIEQGNHVTVEPGNSITAELYNRGRGKESRQHPTKRALTKNEIEKTLRTGIPSDKSLLQALLEPIIYDQRLRLPEFIRRCDEAGISLLFNQASTGRISGITYFINDFKIKGQALGNRFKWAEIIKYIDHEQDRDREAVSAANDNTKAKYGEANPGTGIGIDERNRSGRGTGSADPDAGTNAPERNREREADEDYGLQSSAVAAKDNEFGSGPGQAAEMAELSEVNSWANANDSYMDTALHSYPDIQIADDVDDEAVHGRKRRRQRKA